MLFRSQCFGFSAATPADEEARFRRAMRLIRSTPLSHIAFHRGGDSLSQLDAITHALRLSAEAP